MPLRLDERELRLLREAISILVSPLEADEVDDWRAEVSTVLLELLEGDQAAFLLPGVDGPAFFSAEYSQDVTGPYLEHYRHLDPGRGRVKREKLEVYGRSQLEPESLAELRRSEFYHEFLDPNGMRDAVALFSDPEQDLTPSLWIHRSRRAYPDAGQRGTEILRILLPAFRAGTAARQRYHRERTRLARLLDALGQAVEVTDLGGRTLHRNEDMRRLFANSRRPARLERAIRDVAAAVAAPRREHSLETGRLHRRVVVAGEAFDLAGILLEGHDLMGRRAVLISLTPVPDGLPRKAEVVVATELTPRQADVALLMAQGFSDKKIAAELEISVHTARRHAEAVLRRLGIHSRHDVRRRLVEQAAPPPS